MNLEAAMFDLDGTLVDSLPGIEYSIDCAMRECGCGPRLCEVRPLIGPPIRTIFSLVVHGATSERLDALEAAFRRSYDSDGWQKTIFFEGAQDTLQSLHSAGLSLFLVTNKPEEPTRQILAGAGLTPLFTDIICRNSKTGKFESKADMVRHVLFRHRVSPEASLFVGDTAEDYEAATAAGVRTVLVRHGYGASDKDMPVRDCQWIGYLAELTTFFPVRRSV